MPTAGATPPKASMPEDEFRSIAMLKTGGTLPWPTMLVNSGEYSIRLPGLWSRPEPR